MRRYEQTGASGACPGSTCAFQSPEDLSAYMDKEMPTWKRHIVRRHLKRCEVCAAEVRRLQQMDTFLRESGGVEVSERFLSDVMGRAAAAAQGQQPDTFLSYFTRFAAAAGGWKRHAAVFMDKLRYGIRTRSPVYIFVLTFAVFTTVGVTLYQSDSHRFAESPHALKDSQEASGEKLISFEVIRQEPPKRSLTTALQEK